MEEESMNINFIVKPEATGTFNGREYKGIVIANVGKTKGVQRTYLPDVFNESDGKAMAEYRLRRKMSRKKEIRLTKEFNDINRMIKSLTTRGNALDRKIVFEQIMQEQYGGALLDLVDGMMG